MTIGSKKVARSTKIFYSIGSIAIAAKDHGFNYFLLVFYSQVLGLAPSLASLALFIALFFDAFTDPLVGHASDNLHSRWGRRHPFLYASILPIVVGYYFLWHPPADLTQTLLFCYLVVLSVLVRTFITFFQVPSDAMVAELTDDYDERTSIVGYRHFMGWACGITLATLVYKVFLVDTAEYPDGMLNPVGYGNYGTTAAIFMAVSMLVMSIGTHKLIPTLKAPPAKAPFEFSRTFREILQTLNNRSFFSLFLSGLLFAVAGGVSMTLNFYFSRYYWALSQDQLWYFQPVNLAAAAFAMFLAPRVSRTIDKRSAAIRLWLIAAVFLPVPVVLFMADLFPPSGSNFLLSLLLVHSFIEITLMVSAGILISSMMADLVEDSQKVTGRRSEGLFFSSLSLSSKAVTGFGIIVAGLILEIVEFPVGAAFGEVPEATMRSFGVLAISMIVAFYLLATWAMSFYRITRSGHAENLAAIDA